jgi:hypothetical protein
MVGRSRSLNSVSAGISRLCLDSSLWPLRVRGLLVAIVRKLFLFGDAVTRVVFHSFIHLFIHSFHSYSCCSLWSIGHLWDVSFHFSFLIQYTVGRTPWTEDQPIARPLPTHSTTQTQNKCTQTSIPWVGFEPTIPVFERAKTSHALDHAATVIGRVLFGIILLFV